MTMDEETRIAPLKKWILHTIDEVAKQIGLKLRAEWDDTKHQGEQSGRRQHFVVLRYSGGGTDAGLWFTEKELRLYLSKPEDLPRKIREHLVKWRTKVEPHT